MEFLGKTVAKNPLKSQIQTSLVNGWVLQGGHNNPSQPHRLGKSGWKDAQWERACVSSFYCVFIEDYGSG